MEFSYREVAFLVLIYLSMLLFTSCESPKTPSVTLPDVTPTATLLAGEIRGTPVKPPKVIDRGLLYGDPCSPPCWEDIVPGSTAREEVVQKLEQLKEEGFISDYNTQMFYADFPEGGTVRFVFNDDYVDWMEINRYRLYYKVGQILTDFGEPEGVILRDKFSEGQPCSQWRDEFAWGRSTDVYLIYPSQGVSFAVGIPDAFPNTICPQLEAFIFYYYQPRSLSEALAEERSPVFGVLSPTPEDIISWHGFGPGY